MINPRKPTAEEFEYIAYLATLAPGSEVDNLGLMFFHEEPLEFGKGFANWKVMQKAHEVQEALDLKLSDIEECKHEFTTMMDRNYCRKCKMPDPDNTLPPIFGEAHEAQIS